MSTYTRDMNAILKEADAKQVNGVFEFDPYNNHNIEFTQEDLTDIFHTYGLSGVCIHNIDLYKHAFVHSSYRTRPEYSTWSKSDRIYCKPRPPDCMELVPYDNERMEFLGDGVLECIVKYYLYRRFPIAEPEFLNTSKISLVKNITIGNLIIEMGLNRWYILSKQSEKDGVRTDAKILGCLFEAFVGAIFLDFNHTDRTDEYAGCGFQMASRFIEAVFDKHGAWLAKIADVNYKNRIQIWIQKEFRVVPEYQLMEEYNRENGYHIGLYISVRCSDDIPFRKRVKTHVSQFTRLSQIHMHIKQHGYICMLVVTSIHKSKPEAEQDAANKAFQYMSQIPR